MPFTCEKKCIVYNCIATEGVVSVNARCAGYYRLLDTLTVGCEMFTYFVREVLAESNGMFKLIYHDFFLFIATF